MGTNRIHDRIASGAGEDVIQRRIKDGWRMVAIEWERDVPGEAPDEPVELQPVPFGFCVAEDCRHLQAHPVEFEILSLVMELIVRERPLPAIAESLNEKNYKTRDGKAWTPSRVFELMPFIVDSGPRIIAKPNWPQRRVAAHP